MTEQDWADLADDVCTALGLLYGPKRAWLEWRAARAGCSLDQLAAAALTELVRRRVGHGPSGSMPPDRPRRAG